MLHALKSETSPQLGFYQAGAGLVVRTESRIPKTKSAKINSATDAQVTELNLDTVLMELSFVIEGMNRMLEDDFGGFFVEQKSEADELDLKNLAKDLLPLLNEVNTGNRRILSLAHVKTSAIGPKLLEVCAHFTGWLEHVEAIAEHDSSAPKVDWDDFFTTDEKWSLWAPGQNTVFI
jgi:hypothetical protein